MGGGGVRMTPHPWVYFFTVNSLVVRGLKKKQRSRTKPVNHLLDNCYTLVFLSVLIHGVIGLIGHINIPFCECFIQY